MNLKLYFRLVLASIFQPIVIAQMKDSYKNLKPSDLYDLLHFYCPRIYCNDGWNISLQIHHANYCSSENGYRSFGLNIKDIEWGFPSFYDPDLRESAENPDDIISTVGSLSFDEIEKIINVNHKGIDWDTTLNTDNISKFLKMK